MIEIKKRGPERALLVGVELSQKFTRNHNKNGVSTEESIEELGELARTAGAKVVSQSITKRDIPTPAFFIGKGKVEEFAGLIEQEKINVVIFDDDLSPIQQKHLQENFKVKVIDRTELILDIFAQRARSSEGKLEVELAQMTYLLPRLTRMWTHLSRQEGGIGTRGPGEKQLEVDRRRVRERISHLKEELQSVRQNRATQRKFRQKIQLPTAAIIGYTNVGKSTLLHSLTQAEVLIDDKLFATLDPTARKVILPNKQAIIVTDTVGFIRKLPHHLIESFKATLEEMEMADLLVHLLDVSHPQAEEQYEAVLQTLDQLGCRDKPSVLALNKIDKLVSPFPILWWKNRVSRCVPISAKNKTGFEELFHELEQMLQTARARVDLKIPLSRGDLLSQIYKQGEVLKTHYNETHVILTAEIPKILSNRLAEFLI